MLQKPVEQSAKPVARDAATKVVWQHFSVLELAERLGNVSKAWRRGVSESTEAVEPGGDVKAPLIADADTL